MIPVDIFLFDLDGTLIDSKRDIANAVHHVQKAFHHSLDSEEKIGSFIGDGIGLLIERALPHASAENHKKAVLMMKDYYREHCVDHTIVYPGVREMLDHFSHKKMAIVTNKPERISNRILKNLTLDHYFPVIIGGDTLSQKKPQPEPLLEAIRLLRAESREQKAEIKKPSLKKYSSTLPSALASLSSPIVVMVGDSQNDIHAGRAAGLLTCGIQSNIGNPDELRKSKPDFLISTLSELIRLFN